MQYKRVKLEAVIINKVNKKLYRVIERNENIAHAVLVDDEEGQSVTITPENAICFRCVADAPKVIPKDNYQVVNSVLLKGQEPLEMGEIKAKRILGLIPGKIIFEGEYRGEADVFSYDEDLNKFSAMLKIYGKISVLKAEGTSDVFLKDDIFDVPEATKDEPNPNPVFKESILYRIDKHSKYAMTRFKDEIRDDLSIKVKELFALVPMKNGRHLLIERDEKIDEIDSRKENASISISISFAGRPVVFNDRIFKYGGDTALEGDFKLFDEGFVNLVDVSRDESTTIYSFANNNLEVKTIKATRTSDRGRVIVVS